ncbi:MAG: geranylgeranyl reductase family protein [Desulfobacterales bacterium]|jgi:geranylgeranyl reductase family protein
MNNLPQSITWQLEASSIPDRLWDVVIVGAGPAGAIAAAHLAAGHHRVLLLDRKKFPREKICGDGLLPDALRCLDAIGVGETVRAAGHKIGASLFVSPSRNEVEIPGEYLTIKRSLLDMIVAQKAVDIGAVFACGEVKQLAVEPDDRVSFTIQGNEKRFRARIGILATGVNIRLFHKLNWAARKKPSGVAMRCYVRSSLVHDQLVLAFFSHNRRTVPGYGWIFPMRDHEYNLGCGILSPDRVGKPTINLRTKFKEFIDSFPLARDLMQQSDRATALRAASLRYNFEGAYPFVSGPIVAVGETIGTTLPFIGEGIGKAMESGQLAAEAISRALDSNDLSKLSRYHQQIEFEFKNRYQGYRKAEKWLARPWLNDFIIKRFGNSKYAKKILADVIAETKNPHDIFSLKGIFKSFWN